MLLASSHWKRVNVRVHVRDFVRCAIYGASVLTDGVNLCVRVHRHMVSLRMHKWLFYDFMVAPNVTARLYCVHNILLLL